MADTKACSNCGEPKPLDDFNRDTRTHDGLQSWCKPCKAEAKREARRRRDEDRSDELMKAEEGFDGFAIKGMSTLYGLDEEGNRVPKVQWVKTQKDRQTQVQDFAEAVKALAEPYRGVIEPLPAPQHASEDLQSVYVLGDPHQGMYAWAKETGQDYDLEIGTRVHQQAFDKAVTVSPPSETGVLISVGDSVHSDNQSNRTARSGNALDVDTRWQKVLHETIAMFRWCVQRMLEKHPKVEVFIAIGNHDDHTAIMLSIALQLAFERETRVTVHDSVSRFHYHRFGQNLIGITHGDTCKYKDLPGIMAVDRSQDWGETLHRVWLTGHVHHESVKDFHGVTVETFRTLASTDAWHNGAGYRSKRGMRCDVWHRERGRVTRHDIGVDMIEGTA